MSWFVVDHEANDRPLRGPYEHGETAAAVRREMERLEQYDESNLWVVELPLKEAS
jgi:hypothetical protein